MRRESGPKRRPLIKKAIDADRGNLDLCNDFGNVYFAFKQYSDAAQAFSAATARDSSYALGWYNQAHALRKGAKRWRESAEAYEQYIKLKPDDPDPYYGFGTDVEGLGDSASAINAFQKYVAMEKRPEEQSWVDKARTELQALQSMQGGSSPSGKLDEKSMGDGSGDTAAREQLDRELKRDAVLPPSDDDLRLIDPFTGDRQNTRDLKDPFRGELVDPFGTPAMSQAPAAQKLRDYGVALAAYRRALAHQAETVSARFERGVAGVLAEKPQSAMRAWNTVPLDDPEVAAARSSVERCAVRSLFAADPSASARHG